MKLFTKNADREVLEKYLQELICDVTTAQEVEAELKKPFTVGHGRVNAEETGVEMISRTSSGLGGSSRLI
ncbi:MAG: hypothetical protein WB630_14970 [Candidatus Acidiferrales bacterium]